MRILVTGGAGFVGSVLVPKLLQRSPHIHDHYHVTVLDSFSHGENSLSACCGSPNFEAVRGDARDVRVLEPLVKRADVIIPLAAIVGAPACAKDESAATSTNRQAIATLCGLTSPAQMIVYPNSNSGYGTIGNEEFCTEESPLKPLSLYARTKCEAENVVMDRENSIAFRLATAFGSSPRMRIDLLCNEFVYRAIHDRAVLIFEGHFRRNFIHVEDIANAFIHAINRFGDMKGKVYNAGLSTANVTKMQLAQKIKEHIQDFFIVETDQGTDPDKRDYLVSNARFEATGFRATRSLDDGIVELKKLFTMLRNTRYGNA